MTVFQRPLLMTEHTEFDVGAERIAFEMARRCGVRLHGVLPYASNPEFEVAAPHLAAKAQADAGSRADRVEAQAAAQGVELSLQVRGGSELYEEVIDEARLVGADVIVTRRRGKRGFLAKLMVGEMVSKVIAHAPCSVLVVARGATPWRRRVLVAVDPRTPSEGQLATAIELARTCAVPLHIVSVALDDGGRAEAQAAVADAMATIAAAGPVATSEVRVGKAAEQIVAAVAEADADLVVVGRHGGDSGRHAWIGGVTQKVIGLTECPVLVHITGKPSS
jgi:hypothetical protein